MERLTGLYEAYFEQVRAAQKRLKPAEGLFGMGGGLASAPCHDAFIEALKAFLDSAEVREDPGQVRQILDYIYRAPLAYPDVHPSAYWMLLEAHGLTLQAAGPASQGRPGAVSVVSEGLSQAGAAARAEPGSGGAEAAGHLMLEE